MNVTTDTIRITTITVALALRLGTVNCFLIESGGDFFLVDTGSPRNEPEMAQALLGAGCRPGNLRLIILTHGDFDHIGTAAHLRLRFDTQIAMHRDDLGMAERGEMFWNRKKGNALLGFLAPRMFGFGQDRRFKPDIFVSDGHSLAEYGLAATVVHIPGHSQGSIGLLTAEGDLLAGDLLENVKRPAFNSIMDDPVTGRASLAKLKTLPVRAVFPGHGRPFVLDDGRWPIDDA